MDEQITTFTQPANTVDVDTALQELSKQEQISRTKEKIFKAYVLSVLLPPIGLYYFVKLLFFAEKNTSNQKAAVLCLVLTVISLIVNIWLFQLLLNQAIPEEQLDVLKDLTIPQNQDALQQLLQ